MVYPWFFFNRAAMGRARFMVYPWFLTARPWAERGLWFTRVAGLCLNPTAQKDNRGVLGASFRVEQFSEIVGYSNMADYTNHIICELPVLKLC